MFSEVTIGVWKAKKRVTVEKKKDSVSESSAFRLVVTHRSVSLVHGSEAASPDLSAYDIVPYPLFMSTAVSLRFPILATFPSLRLGHCNDVSQIG